MTKKSKKRIMRSFKMTFISGVDRPAQSPAEVLLMKRDDVAKMWGEYSDPVMTEESMGHSHILDKANGRGGETSYAMAEGSDSNHSHPWVLNGLGEVVIGTSYGHSHGVVAKAWNPEDDGFTKREFTAEQRQKLSEEGKALPDGSYPIVTRSDLKNAIQAFGRAKNKGRVASHIKRRARELDALDLLPSEGSLATKKSVDGNEPKEQSMTIEEMKKELEEVQGELAVAKAFGALSDAEKAHYAGLDEAGKAEFLKMDADGRGAEVAKAQADDPVVYKSDDGQEFRKSDDPRVVKMAKKADAEARANAELRDQLAGAALAKRADEEMDNLPGESGVKVALLKAIDGIVSEEFRKGALAILKAGNDALVKAFDRAGSGNAVASDAAARYETLAKKYAEDNKCTIEQARADVLTKTEEGAKLAEELCPRK